LDELPIGSAFLQDAPEEPNGMSDLLKLALAAHGGFERWNWVTQIQARVTAGSILFSLKGMPTLCRDIEMTLSSRKQHDSFEPFNSFGKRSCREQ
jgi:hypothetical protein